MASISAEEEEGNCEVLCHPAGIPGTFPSEQSQVFGKLAQTLLPGAEITQFHLIL